jgi:hypothetical protein
VGINHDAVSQHWFRILEQVGGEPDGHDRFVALLALRRMVVHDLDAALGAAAYDAMSPMATLQAAYDNPRFQALTVNLRQHRARYSLPTRPYVRRFRPPEADPNRARAVLRPGWDPSLA